MKELKMTKDEALLFARRYVESVTGEETIGSFPIQSENSEIIYIGVTVKSERKFKVRIHPYVGKNGKTDPLKTEERDPLKLR